MKFMTKLFGEVEVEDNKMLTFSEGIIGYPHMQHFYIMYDMEKGKESKIKWLQSVEEGAFALPIIDPLFIVPDYNPKVEDELFTQLGETGEDGLLVFVTLRVPPDITKMSINLRAPIIINPETRKCRQIILENDQYEVRYPAYEVLKKKKEKEGE